MNLYYSPAYVAGQCDFETRAKARWIADSLRKRPIDGVTIVKPESCSVDELLTVHNPLYVKAVKTGKPKVLAGSSGLGWDADVFGAVCASNGGVIDALNDALDGDGNAGTLSSGLHHAKANYGHGFCTFNGLAVAATIAAFSGARILILDFDAHCGGGTHSIVETNRDIAHCDISICRFDEYKPKDRSKFDAYFEGRNTLDIVENPGSTSRCWTGGSRR